jgi:hypothetical protein
MISIESIFNGLSPGNRSAPTLHEGVSEETSIHEAVQTTKDQTSIRALLVENFGSIDSDIFLRVLNQNIQNLPENTVNENYWRLLGLVLRLSAEYQYPKITQLGQVYAKKESTTGVNRFHPLLILRSAVYLADVNLQQFVLKEQIAHALEARLHTELNDEQRAVLNALCFGRQKNSFVLFPSKESDSSKEAILILENGVLTSKALDILQNVIDQPKVNTSLLTERYRNRNLNPGQFPYTPPELGLCLQLQSTGFSDQDAYDLLSGGATPEAQERFQACQQALQSQVDLGALYRVSPNNEATPS